MYQIFFHILMFEPDTKSIEHKHTLSAQCRLIVTDQGRNERGKGVQFPSAKSLRRAPKSTNNVTSTPCNAVYFLPKDHRFEHRGAKLASCPGRYITLLRPCNSAGFRGTQGARAPTKRGPPPCSYV